MTPQKFCVAATFAAEPLAEILTFWMAKAGRQAEVVLAPAYQIFQQLLDPTSELSQNRDGINLLAVRCEDWHFHEDDNARDCPGTKRRLWNAPPVISAPVCGSPPRRIPPLISFHSAPPPQSPPETVALFEELEARIMDELAESRNVHFVCSVRTRRAVSFSRRLRAGRPSDFSLNFSPRLEPFSPAKFWR